MVPNPTRPRHAGLFCVSPSTAIRLWSLSLADLIVSKLRRWHPRDRADVRHGCDRHPEVRERLAAVSEGDFFAVDWCGSISASLTPERAT